MLPIGTIPIRYGHPSFGNPIYKDGDLLFIQSSRDCKNIDSFVYIGEERYSKSRILPILYNQDAQEGDDFSYGFVDVDMQARILSLDDLEREMLRFRSYRQYPFLQWNFIKLFHNAQLIAELQTSDALCLAAYLIGQNRKMPLENPSWAQYVLTNGTIIREKDLMSAPSIKNRSIFLHGDIFSQKEFAQFALKHPLLQSDYFWLDFDIGYNPRISATKNADKAAKEFLRFYLDRYVQMIGR